MPSSFALKSAPQRLLSRTHEPREFRHVLDAVQTARREFSSNLRFLDSALRSASATLFERPRRVYELFRTLNDLVTLWQEKGSLGMPWFNALSQHGFPYRSHLSYSTIGAYADDYTFTYDSRRIVFAQHVTLGAKHPATCLSVHWLRDDTKKILVVGWCGRHGANTKT